MVFSCGPFWPEPVAVEEEAVAVVEAAVGLRQLVEVEVEVEAAVGLRQLEAEFRPSGPA